jgi:hypothetical protein
MAQIEIKDGQLAVTLSLMDTFLAAHGSLHIPLEHIAAVRVADESGWKMMWRKLIGTSAPGWKMAGTFFADGGFVFCDFKDGAQCLEIDLKDETYKQLIIQLDSFLIPEKVAAQIQSAIPK